MYGFLLNMWVMGRIDEDYLTKAEAIGRITKEEKRNDFSYATTLNKEVVR